MSLLHCTAGSDLSNSRMQYLSPLEIIKEVGNQVLSRLFFNECHLFFFFFFYFFFLSSFVSFFLPSFLVFFFKNSSTFPRKNLKPHTTPTINTHHQIHLRLKLMLRSKIHPLGKIHPTQIQLLINIRKHAPHKSRIPEKLIRELRQNRRLLRLPRRSLRRRARVHRRAQPVDHLQTARRETVVAQRWVQQEALGGFDVLEPGGRVGACRVCH